jgi:hypothetical protein
MRAAIKKISKKLMFENPQVRKSTSSGKLQDHGQGFKTMLLTAVTIAGIMIYATNLSTTLIFVSSFVLFSLPGVALYRLYYPGSSVKEILIAGCPLGIGISSLLCAFVGWLVNTTPYYCIAIILGCASILWSIGVKYFNPPDPSKIRRNQSDNSLFYFLVITSILVTLSYSSFGAETPKGFAFKDLYATDLLHHMSVFVHLPQGIPPSNPYFSGQPWHYYWISHMFPAFVYSISGFSLVPRNIMLLTSITYLVLFVSALYFLITSYFKDKKIIVFLMVLSLFAYGYNDLFVMFKHMVLSLPESIVKQVHLDYLVQDVQGEQYTGYSHGWFRNFLVEPHSTLALSILFVVVILMKREERFVGKGKNLFRGLLFGMIFSIDAFIGAISICWYSLNLLRELLNKNMLFRKNVYYAVWFFLPIGLIFAFLYGLKIVSPGSSYLVLKPYGKMIILSPLYFIIDYGLMSVLGFLGIYLSVRHKESGIYSTYITLILTCLFFMFFVNLANIGSTQMIRKGGMIIRVPLIIFSGVSLKYFFNKYYSKMILAVLCLAIVIALPTPAFDMYKLSDWKTGASFIKQQDMKAQQWIKISLPKDCIVQDFPTTITPILAFGERRVAMGDWEHAISSGIKPDEVASRFKKIKQLFETDDPYVAYQIARNFFIDYIYLNGTTREKFVKGSEKFETNGDLFKLVYARDEVEIYKVGAL